MKYFFEIENWQKYFGFIFKQGSNASTTSMHPTPMVITLNNQLKYIIFTTLRPACINLQMISVPSHKLHIYRSAQFRDMFRTL
jgi:hypothetical protein